MTIRQITMDELLDLPRLANPEDYDFSFITDVILDTKTREYIQYFNTRVESLFIYQGGICDDICIVPNSIVIKCDYDKKIEKLLRENSSNLSMLCCDIDALDNDIKYTMLKSVEIFNNPGFIDENHINILNNFIKRNNTIRMLQFSAFDINIKISKNTKCYIDKHNLFSITNAECITIDDIGICRVNDHTSTIDISLIVYEQPIITLKRGEYVIASLKKQPNELNAKIIQTSGTALAILDINIDMTNISQDIPTTFIYASFAKLYRNIKGNYHREHNINFHYKIMRPTDDICKICNKMFKFIENNVDQLIIDDDFIRDVVCVNNWRSNFNTSRLLNILKLSSDSYSYINDHDEYDALNIKLINTSLRCIKNTQIYLYGDIHLKDIIIQFNNFCNVTTHLKFIDGVINVTFYVLGKYIKQMVDEEGNDTPITIQNIVTHNVQFTIKNKMDTRSNNIILGNIDNSDINITNIKFYPMVLQFT